MKKVLMVTHTMLPDHRIDREAKILAEKNFQVYIICTGYKREPSQVYTKVFTIQLDNFEKSLLPYFARKAAKRYEKIIKEIKPDIIHAHDIMAANIVRFVIPKGVKFVYDTHEDWELLRKRQRKIEPNFVKKLAIIFYTFPATKFITKKIAKSANLIVLTTKYSIPYFLNLGIAKDNIITIENFALLSIIKEALLREDLVDDFIKSDPRKKMVHSSTRVKLSAKIVRDVSEFAKAVNELDDWVMVVFGPEDEEFKKMGVHFLPPRPQIEYLASIAKCDVAINPLILDERTNYSSPNRVFEFVSLGLKVISSKSVYLEDKFGDKLIWADTNTPKEKIKEILRNIEKYPNKEELQKISEKFNWESEMDNLIAKYHEILK
ncbi:MAG: hypothetical protein EAX90_08295 [Candidatus Heimdallarchaeota archaeon]|nr:hypothetical protein [Candidatus Heimdallarchaeota archaeon]